MVSNVYQNGLITQERLRGVLSAVTAAVSGAGNEGTPSRNFKEGEKLMVTKITVQNDSVAFQVISNPVNANNDRYRGTLKFRSAGKNALGADQAATLIAEVFRPE